MEIQKHVDHQNPEGWLPRELKRKMVIQGTIGATLSILTLSCPVRGGLFNAGVAAIQEKVEPLLQEADKANAYFLSYGLGVIAMMVVLGTIGIWIGVAKATLLTLLTIPLYPIADNALKILLDKR